MHVIIKRTVFNVGSTLDSEVRLNVFPFLVQNDVGSDDELRILP